MSWDRLHVSVVRLEHQSSVIIGFGKLIPGWRSWLLMRIGVEATDETRPEALNDRDTWKVHTIWLVGCRRVAESKAKYGSQYVLLRRCRAWNASKARCHSHVFRPKDRIQF
jgi:hypothetical protein